MTTAVAQLGADLWAMVISLVVKEHADVVGTEESPKTMIDEFLAKMAVSELFMRLVRESLELGQVCRIRCTLAEVPVAVAMFKSITELMVIGDDQGPHEPVVDAARAALERAGRFKTLVSCNSDMSRMAWLPLGNAAGTYSARCHCWTKRPLGDVAESLNRAGVTDLSVNFLGDPPGYPYLWQLPLVSRLVLISMDLEGEQPAPITTGRLESPTVNELVLASCNLQRMPPVMGLPGLLKLELRGCVFEGTNVLKSLEHTQIESLIITDCEGVEDGSPIAQMPRRKSLVFTDCVAAYNYRDTHPDFSPHAKGILKQRLLSHGLSGVLCKVIVNRLGIERRERLALGGSGAAAASAIVQCSDECCRLCDCEQPGCEICEELGAEGW